jgi:hypothetical protein
MFELKPLSPDAIPGALAKAERYRLLNEAAEAESICLDVLDVDPLNQKAYVMLILALSDQIHRDPGHFRQAMLLLPRLDEAYDRAYYAGLLWERRAKARFEDGGPPAKYSVYDWTRRAMEHFEQAEKLRAHGNDDALLRWNTCARFLMKHPELTPHGEEAVEPLMSE